MKNNLLKLPLLLLLLMLAGKGIAQTITIPNHTPIKFKTTNLQTYKPANPHTNTPNSISGCANDSVVLTRQSQIDSFPINNPGCTVLRYLTIDGTNASPAITRLDSLKYIHKITEHLYVSHTSVINLSGLQALDSVGVFFWIDHNPLMTSISHNGLKQIGYIIFDSLPNLKNITGLTSSLISHDMGTMILDITGLTNLTGLEGIQSLPNMYLYGNHNLKSLQGLQNLASCDGGISLFYNDSLTNISALNQINNIQYGTLEVSYCYLLPNLTGLGNITTIGGGLWMAGNDNLTSLNTLNPNLTIFNNSFNSNPPDSVRITYNNQLSLCSNNALCNYLNNSGGAEIHDNAPGCNNISEIQANCALAGDTTTENEDNCCTYNANILDRLKVKTGNVGKYLGLDTNGDPVYDDYDTYRMIVTHDGSAVLNVTAHNDSCATGHDYWLDGELLDKNGNDIKYLSLFYWSGDTCNTVKSGFFKIRALATDTFYLRLNGSGPISYSLSYNLEDSTVSDVEPNDNQANAIAINFGETKKGHVNFKKANYYDPSDYYKVYLPYDANVRVYVKSIFRGDYNQFNSLQVQCVNNNQVRFSPSSGISYTDTESLDTLNFCALGADTLFFRIYNNSTPFEYEFRVEIIDSLPADIEPNNSYETGTIITQGQTLSSTLGKSNRANGRDNFDYFQTVLPKAGKVRVIVEAKNSLYCGNGTITLRGYNYKKTLGLQVTKEIGNGSGIILGATSIVSPGATVRDTVFICGQAADSFYFRFESTTAFSYNFRYDVVDTAVIDVEPNNLFTEGIPVNPLEIKKGSLGFLINRTYTDVNDVYRTILQKDGTVKVFAQAINNSCSALPVTFAAFDRRQGSGQIFTKNLGTSFSVQPGQTVYDTMSICGLAADTFYFRFNSSGAFNYQFSYQLNDTSANDSEPNGDFPTATPIAELETKEGHIKYFKNGGNDDLDYYKTKIPVDGSMKVMIEATNRSCANNRYVYLRFYDGRKGNGQIYEKFMAGTSNVSAGQTVYDTILFCGRAVDSFYIRFEATAAFTYKLKYQMMDTSGNDVEPNASFETAVNIAVSENKKGHIKYYANGGTDDYDYYRTVLPSDGTVKIIIQATNTNCSNGQWIYFHMFDQRKGSGDLFGRYIANNSNVPAGQTIYDTILVCGRAADTFYYRFEASQPFSYQIKYEMADLYPNDVEPNNSFETAVPIAHQETKQGHIKYYANGGSDDYDHYKTVLPSDGTVKIIIQATNTNCSNGQWLYFHMFDRRQGSGDLFGRYVGNNSSVSAGQTIYDTILVCGRAADTFYYRFEASQPFIYQLKYEMVDQYTNDVEPNNTFETSIPIAHLENKQGHIKYYANGGSDDYDHYKTVLPSDGTVKIIIQATNTNCSNGQWLYFHMFDRRKGSGDLFGKYVGNNSSVSAGQTIYDTIYVCGKAADTFYYRFEASQPFAYQIKYQMVDVSANDPEPNGSFETAVRVGGAKTNEGHIKYSANGGTDDYDYYKFIFDVSDSLKINLEATNTSCINGQWTYVHLFDKRKGSGDLLGRYLGNNSSVAAGQTVTDFVKIWVPAPDTIYLRFEASQQFKYKFTANSLFPSLFGIAGDTTACLGTQRIFKAVNVVDGGVTYNWSLPNGGGSISSTDSIATVTWSSTGTRTVQLILSNSAGSSQPQQFSVVVNNNPPPSTPVASNSYRTLSTNALPAGTGIQWFRNNVLIPGATSPAYYAALAGSYYAKFTNDCGLGASSNTIILSADALPQSITFTHTPNIVYSPSAKGRVIATSSSGLPVFFQLVSGPATLVNDSIFITGAGTVVVRALQPGDDTYLPASPVTDEITVSKGIQNISFAAIPDTILSSNPVIPNASSSSGLPVTFSIAGGSASVSGNNIFLSGAGIITIQANQVGNENYNAATPVQRSFCVGVRTLSAITGEASPCLSTYTYYAQNIPGANYVWTLSDGGTLINNGQTANITWTVNGTHTITVKANSPCDLVYSTVATYVITNSTNTPVPVTNMLPVNNITDQFLPLTLSWLPGQYTVNYDLYIWDSAVAQPASPTAANLSSFAYTIPAGSLVYNKTYKWKVVSKNPCYTVSGPVQQFRLLPLPDLAVGNVHAPTSAFSGQTISFDWTVTNVGPTRTNTNQGWTDAVFLSFDTMPNFLVPPAFNPAAWSIIDFPIRPLLIGTKPNLTALDPGQSYTNSINFTLPLNYGQPLYIYVITNYAPGANAPAEFTRVNDTARAPNAIQVTVSPTPDLRVDTVFTPATTFSGSAINLTYKVKNYGVLTPAGNLWTDKIYISPNQLFNINNATLLKTVKSNGTYYPFAPDAAIAVGGQVLHDSVYTRNLQVVIPNFIFGTYFIYVQTNADKTLYEGALVNNNLNQSLVQVFLTPTPHLTISSLTTPADSLSTTQPVGLNWNIFNAGFKDNIEKNKGHYPVIGGQCLISSCPANPPPGTACTSTPGTQYLDSLGFGSSYWIDRIYLSTDSVLNIANATLLNETTHGALYGGYYSPDNLLNHPCVPVGTSPVYLANNIGNVINPATNYPSTTNLAIPQNIQQGKYYIYVLANATKSVFEYPGTPEIKRTGQITILRPDATVSSVTVPAAVVGGATFALTYNVLNTGPGSVYNHYRNDKIYVSTSPVFNPIAQLITTLSYTESLPAGTPVVHTLNYTFPPSTTGTRYFFVVTNFDSTFKENNYFNNVSTPVATIVSPGIPADLIVSSITLADTVKTINSTYIKYTVSNGGTGTATGIWHDSIYISCSPVFNTANSFAVAARGQTRTMKPGGSYSDSFYISVPYTFSFTNSCFPNIDINNAYFYVRTNANNGVYEGTATTNNTTGTGVRTVINTLVDHIVTVVNGADTATVGRDYLMNWTVKNIGENPGINYNQWFDAVYFSPDSVFSLNAIGSDYFLENTLLSNNQTYSETRNVKTPNVPAGNYYVFVKTNFSNSIPAEKITANNTNLVRTGSGAAKKISVVKPFLPDLIDSIISIPSTVAIGQPLSFTHRTRNSGLGATYPGNWGNRVWLSNDFIPGNTNDILLTAMNHSGALQPGQFSDQTVNVNIPMNIPAGNYVLIVQLNVYGDVFETSTSNNLGFGYITVLHPLPADLFVENILKPDTVFLGYTLDTAKWVIRNNSPNNATGISSDGIYLTKSNVLDSNATLIGIKYKTINMAPLAADTVRMAPLVNNVVEGLYNVFVKADVLNNIVESNKDNNASIASTPLYVKVKELPLNVLTPNTLQSVSRYYKLIIPDSLRGSTILVSLKSTDSLLKKNQLYIGAGYIPSAAQFDYKYGIPDYGNQDIIMTDVNAPLYYITISSTSANPVAQNITIKAVKLPFAIVSIHSTSGGNTGNVTIKITGSLYTQGMTARLSKSGTTINSSSVYFVNSTTVYATFNLQSQPLGIYDITLKKGDTASAVLGSAFSIVPANNGGLITGGGINAGPSGSGNDPGCAPGASSGLNSQLVLEMIVPDKVFAGWPFVIQINYSNPTNVDIPAQSRVLFSERNILMALTPAGVSSGTTTLNLELIEPGGPPGIVRAGGSGTILVYAKAPISVPAHTYVYFKLK